MNNYLFEFKDGDKHKGIVIGDDGTRMVSVQGETYEIKEVLQRENELEELNEHLEFAKFQLDERLKTNRNFKIAYLMLFTAALAFSKIESLNRVDTLELIAFVSLVTYLTRSIRLGSFKKISYLKDESKKFINFREKEILKLKQELDTIKEESSYKSKLISSSFSSGTSLTIIGEESLDTWEENEKNVRYKVYHL